MKWIYPVMYKVIAGIEQGDAACRRIGAEFIEEDRKFTFGKIVKSNTARALRRSELTTEEQERIRRRLVAMLIEGNVPHEYKQYVKLLKKIGVGEYRDEVESRNQTVEPICDEILRLSKGRRLTTRSTGARISLAFIENLDDFKFVCALG